MAKLSKLNKADSHTDLIARVEREKIAHEEDDVLAENVRIKSRFPHIYVYPSHVRLLKTMDDEIEVTSKNGLRILDYGCGKGENSLKCLKQGGRVEGIDISSTYIKQATKSAIDAEISPELYSFQVMDAHAMTFEDNSFDLVFGYGILHHLDPDIALSEIHRVLKPGGRVMLQEPLAGNPLLKLFRLLTPHARSEDEEPFSKAEIDRLCSKNEWKTELVYCGLFELPLAMVTSILIPKHPDNIVMRALDRFERWSHRHKLLLGWNQYFVFNMVKTQNTGR